MRKTGAVIFDMDGVLVDSEPFHHQIEKELFKRLGITIEERVHHSYLGVSSELMYSDIISRYGLTTPIEDLMDLDNTFKCNYFSSLKAIYPMEGVTNLLLEIQASGLKLAVATSSSFELARILLSRCKIASLFDAIVTASEAGKSKPEPEVYLLSAQKLGVLPTKCVVFEDSPNGLLAAKNAGMYCIAIQSNKEIIQGLSAEVVQLYINDVISSVNTPVKRLQGFDKVMLNPGEKKKIEFNLKSEQLSLLDQNLKRVVEPGIFKVMIGSSSENIRLKGEFEVKK